MFRESLPDSGNTAVLSEVSPVSDWLSVSAVSEIQRCEGNKRYQNTSTVSEHLYAKSLHVFEPRVVPEALTGVCVCFPAHSESHRCGWAGFTWNDTVVPF